MLKKIFFLTVLQTVVSELSAQKYEPVYAPEKVVTDTFFRKYVVHDPYRWLENINDKQTLEWVNAENKMAKRYLKKVSFKAHTYDYIHYTTTVLHIKLR